VDRFAIDMGVSADDPRRIAAGVLFELRYNLTAGHSFLPEQKLIPATAQLLDVTAEAVENSIAQLLEADCLRRDRLADIDVLYLPAIYQAETYCARRLSQHTLTRYPSPASLTRKLQRVIENSALEYSAQQELALQEAATSGLLIITGGPGTGKTTVVNGILELYAQMGLRCVLCAPTGRAAKRLTEVTGVEASTIHRLLEASIDPHTGKLFFQKDEADPLKADAVIVDEMSMVDIQLLGSLLQAVPSTARLILVGDPDQLPPVGPGFPFSDMIRSKMLPCVHLTEIFRQA
jgi:exodeoxyribonuclease V alpha subunit